MGEIVQHVAVKVVIVDKEGRVLLLRKGNDDVRHAGKSGRYNLPGGKIKVGESITDAIKREVYEETGLTVIKAEQNPLLVGEWHPEIKGTTHQIIGIFFACTEWTGEVTIDSEHDSFTWVDPSTLVDYDILSPEDKAIPRYFNLKDR